MKELYSLFTALVLLVLLVPLVCTFAFPEELKANQVVTAKPAVTKADGSININYLDDVGTWFKNNFGLRQHFITAYSSVLDNVFGTSPVDEVIVGKDDYLFYSDEEESFIGNKTVSDRKLYSAAINLALIEEYTKSQGADFVFTVAPNKSSVLPEKMPARYTAKEGSNRDILENYVAELGVNYLDMFSVLSQESDEVIYHKLDSHWNNLGAAMGAKAVNEALGVEGTDYLSMPYEKRTDFEGDLYAMLYPYGTELDDNYYFDFTPSFTADERNSDPTAMNYITENSSEEHSLLMFRDSFGNAIAPLLAEDYGKAVFKRAVPYDLTQIAMNKSDKVVLEIVERNVENLAKFGAKFPAFERSVSAVKSNDSLSFNCEGVQDMALIKISGNIACEADLSSRIYVKVNSKVYEAMQCGENSEGENFTLYVPNDQSESMEISVMITVDNELTESPVQTVNIESQY
ncbi:MAG: hypothetical protein Q4C42_05340 [Clostridia bacterium]|nr:hypothetical protein [Clostridia bacterium]